MSTMFFAQLTIVDLRCVYTYILSAVLKFVESWMTTLRLKSDLGERLVNLVITDDKR